MISNCIWKILHINICLISYNDYFYIIWRIVVGIHAPKASPYRTYCWIKLYFFYFWTIVNLFSINVYNYIYLYLKYSHASRHHLFQGMRLKRPGCWVKWRQPRRLHQLRRQLSWQRWCHSLKQRSVHPWTDRNLGQWNPANYFTF